MYSVQVSIFVFCVCEKFYFREDGQSSFRDSLWFPLPLPMSFSVIITASIVLCATILQSLVCPTVSSSSSGVVIMHVILRGCLVVCVVCVSPRGGVVRVAVPAVHSCFKRSIVVVFVVCCIKIT